MHPAPARRANTGVRVVCKCAFINLTRIRLTPCDELLISLALSVSTAARDLNTRPIFSWWSTAPYDPLTIVTRISWVANVRSSSSPIGAFFNVTPRTACDAADTGDDERGPTEDEADGKGSDKLARGVYARTSEQIQSACPEECSAEDRRSDETPHEPSTSRTNL